MKVFMLTALAFMLAAPAARASEGRPAEITWATGVSYFASPDRTVVGLGGGPGVQFWLSEDVFVGIQSRYLLFAGNALGLSAEIGMGYPMGKVYFPGGGVSVGTFFGSQLRSVRSDDPKLTRLPPLAVRAVLSPLHFRWQHSTASLLEIAYGIGTGRGGIANTFEITVLKLATAF